MTAIGSRDESLRPRLAPELLQRLRTPSLGVTLAFIALDYSVIAAAIWAGIRSWWFAPLALVVVAGRQHSLLIFMHEAAHRSLSRNAWLNDLLGNILCAWPMLLDVGAFRHVHLQHHRYEGELGDPDFAFRSGEEWTFPRPRRQIFVTLLRDLTGLNVLGAIRQVKYYGEAPPEERRWMRAIRLGYFAVACAALVWCGGVPAFALFWLVPIVTLLKCFIRIREIAEHYGLPAQSELDRTRTTSTSWLGRMLISPRNIHYHLEHHLYPGIPWHSLPALRRALLLDARYAAESAHSPSYLAALCECSTDRRANEPRLHATPQRIAAEP